MSGRSRVIAFDGSILGAGPITGVAGSFLTTLRHYVTASKKECVLLLPRDTTLELDGVRSINCLPRGRWRRLRALRRVCKEIHAAVLHSPIAAVPLRNNCPVIATVHDVPWLYPALLREPGCRRGQRIALQLAMRFADAVIVPSKKTAEDAGCCLTIDPSRVRMIPHGVDTPTELADAAALRGPFLVLGDDRPRKNLVRVQRAHALARERSPNLPALRRLGPDHGYVDEATKWSTLRQSRALLHLSLLEGFGLPVLEAFAHGVPVVCSDRGSLPEVAGDAALTADPEDIEAMAAAIVRIDADETLRAELRSRGAERAARFTPDLTAKAWRELHEELTA